MTIKMLGYAFCLALPVLYIILVHIFIPVSSSTCNSDLQTKDDRTQNPTAKYTTEYIILLESLDNLND